MSQSETELSVSGTSRTQTQARQDRKRINYYDNFNYGVVESIEKFDGKAKVKEFLEIIETTGELYERSEEMKMKICKVKLRGLALELVNQNRHIGSWNELKRLLINHFSIKVTPFQAMQRFQNTSQNDNEPILEFSQRIEQAGRQTIQLTGDRMEDEVLRSTAGMLPYLREKVVLRGTSNFKNAVEIAMEMEANIKTWRRPERMQTVQQRPQPVCFSCGKPGHYSRDCRNKRSPSTNEKNNQRSSPSQVFQMQSSNTYEGEFPKNWQGGNQGKPPNRPKRF